MIKTTNLISIVILVTVLFGCSKDSMFNSKQYTPPQAIYNFPDNKLWKHRVNSANEAITALKEFNGIELDVYFIEGENKYITGHDAPNGTNLETYFDSIPNCSAFYYWIDFKNLNTSNMLNSIEKMKSIIAKYNLKDKLIIENSNADLLAFFKFEEIFTSLWIPDITGEFLDYYAEQKLIEELETILSKYKFDAVSADYHMMSFLEQYLKNYNIHVWTNGLISEDDKDKIRKFAKKDNIKVILVDYEDNFLK